MTGLQFPTIPGILNKGILYVFASLVSINSCNLFHIRLQLLVVIVIISLLL